jgi:hypothetical protein
LDSDGLAVRATICKGRKGVSDVIWLELLVGEKVRLICDVVSCELVGENHTFDVDLGVDGKRASPMCHVMSCELVAAIFHCNRMVQYFIVGEKNQIENFRRGCNNERK